MNLTQEQYDLLNTDFPAEFEKDAAEQVSTLNELFDMGFYKMAESAADKMEEEEEEEEEEEKKKPENKLNEGQKKEAAARGAFLARYYVEGLMKEGSERRGDELHFLYPSLTEALEKGAALTDKEQQQRTQENPHRAKTKAQGEQVGMIQGAKNWLHDYHTGAISDLKTGISGHNANFTKTLAHEAKALHALKKTPQYQGASKAQQKKMEAERFNKVMKHQIKQEGGHNVAGRGGDMQEFKKSRAEGMGAQEAARTHGKLRAGERAKLIGKGALKFAPHAGALGLAGYGIHRGLTSGNKQEQATAE